MSDQASPARNASPHLSLLSGDKVTAGGSEETPPLVGHRQPSPAPLLSLAVETLVLDAYGKAGMAGSSPPGWARRCRILW